MRKKIRLLFLVTAIMIWMVGVTASAEEVLISKAKATINVGDTIELNVTGTEDVVVWASYNPNIAKVNAKGKVTALKAGKTIIRARAGKDTKTCAVTVMATSVKLNKTSAVLNCSGASSASVSLKATVKGVSRDVAWTSSDSSVATVDTKGKVTSAGVGTAIITASANGRSASCRVTVNSKNTSDAAAIDIVEDAVALKTKGTDKTYTLATAVTGKKGTVTWKSDNTSVVSVSKGKLTAKKAGTAKVTATANGVSDTVDVTVTDFKPTVTLNADQYTLYTGKGSTATLKATVEGADKTVAWSSSDTSVATVTKKGKVTAAGPGMTTITATANGVSGTCVVTVKKTGIILSSSYLKLSAGENRKLSYDVVGAKQTVKWSTSNSRIAAIKNGVITAKKDGEADIKLTSNGVTAICHVVVDSNACDHMYDSGVITKAATCFATGIRTYTCTKCGDDYNVDLEAAAHNYRDTVIAPTCMEQGYTMHECVVCGDGYVDSYTDKAPHAYADIVVAATCIAEGYTTHECTVCGDSYVDSYTEKAPHTYGDWKVVVEPAETEEGIKERICDVCGDIEKKPIPSKSHKHNYAVTVVEPTCTEVGYTIHSCAECEDVYTDNYVDALGHEEGAWVETVKATCTGNGYMEKYCARCGYCLDAKTVEAAGHAAGEWVVVKQATCIDVGYEEQYCTRCNTSLDMRNINATGHKAGDWAVKSEPTCHMPGYKSKDCVNCGMVMEVEEIESPGHAYVVDKIVEPTKCGRGYTIYKCSICGAKWEDDYVIWTGDGYHNYDYYNVKYNERDKVYYVYCKDCKAYKGEEWETILKYRQVDEMIDGIIADIIDNDMNDAEKILAVNNWICMHCSYDKDTLYGTENGNYDSNHYIGVFLNGKAICTGYAEAFKYFMNHLGIECRIVSSEQLLHAWNQVKLDDGWYWIDCTWNDRDGDDFHQNGYFLKTGQRIFDEVNGVECNGVKWEYGLPLFEKYTLYSESDINRIYKMQKDNDAVYFLFDEGVNKTSVWNKLFMEYANASGESFIVSSVGRLTYIKNTPGVKSFFENRIANGCIDGKKHSYSETGTAPTCTQRGYTTYTCVCGDSYIGSYVDALGHEAGDWVITDEPTCSFWGKRQTNCIRCGITIDRESLEPTGDHDYVAKSVIAPTNCGKGYTLYKCSVCGVEKHGDEVPCIGDGRHEWDVENVAEPIGDTCRVYCTSCDSYTILKAEEISKSREAALKVKTVIDQIISAEMCDAEKILAVNNWICMNCYYDFDTARETENALQDSYRFYGMLLNGKAVCNGYAEAFKLFMKNLGIECRLVTSVVLDHAWNQVKLDDGWYWLDCTWNDSDSDDSYNNSYFLQSGMRIYDEVGGTVCNGTKWVNGFPLYETFSVSTEEDIFDVYIRQEDAQIVYFMFDSADAYNALWNIPLLYAQKYSESLTTRCSTRSDGKYFVSVQNCANLHELMEELYAKNNEPGATASDVFVQEDPVPEEPLQEETPEEMEEN